MGSASMSLCCGALSKVKPYLLMVGLQFGSAGMYVISAQTLKNGMSRYVLIVYRNAIAALVLAPFALILERSLLSPKYCLARLFGRTNSITCQEITKFHFTLLYFRKTDDQDLS